MKRLASVLATAALAGALSGVTPPATAAPTCADTDHPVRGYNKLDLAVGVRKTQTFELGVFPLKGCGVQSVVAVVTSARNTYRVTLRQEVASDPALDTWTGDLRVRPRELRNSEAGVWTVRYEVSGEHPESLDTQGQVVRAVRLDFNAGPEPVVDDTITYWGRLERASWNTHDYAGISRPVSIVRTEEGGGPVPVASATTRGSGRVRVTQPFPGAGDYRVLYAGDATSAFRYSYADHVDAP